MKKCAIHKASGNFVEFGAKLTIADADINLYAVWASTKIAEKYTVTYDLDGGISTADKLIYPDIPHGEATPKIAEPTKTGYSIIMEILRKIDPIPTDRSCGMFRQISIKYQLLSF